jgi:hypothetical protein
LPKRRLGIPSRFEISAEQSRGCWSQKGDLCGFDFTGLAPLPNTDLESRAILLLENIEDMQRNHPDVFTRLGISVTVRFEDGADA